MERNQTGTLVLDLVSHGKRMTNPCSETKRDRGRTSYTPCFLMQKLCVHSFSPKKSKCCGVTITAKKSLVTNK